ncbi:hypothetical protein ABI_23510 [Asticcacaulis biprosthecium C19]|uniref:Putative auto-transporter adhesin head GIN domain-containing protein n=1 Tax=Asticcacaulis biprosthecium C19 TaxID=715226 RepID=F4QNN1_9CAUL|nr:DUF2807 domain-containing protein [Asticcacaulis biprosthecium]EGF90939.1 hypothetical protein ABI_23510 [Asticcacaulis biprosthecium C19]
MRKSLITFAASIVAITLATDAVAQMRLISDGPQIELRDLAARVVVTPEDRSDIDIKVRYGKAKVPTLMISQRGNVTVLNGHLSGGKSKMNLHFNEDDLANGQVAIAGLGKVRFDDLPLIFVRVPNNAVVKDAALTVGHVKPSRSLDMIMSGAGSWTVEPVSGPLNIINSGAGDISVSTAGDSIIDNMGSGDINVQSVRKLKLTQTGSGGFSAHNSQDVEIFNQGSGDVEVLNARSVKAKMNGSGDLTLGNVMNGLTLVNNGSSDVSVQKIAGPVSLSLAGSGDVDIAGGHIPGFVMKGSGSGDVAFGGIAGTVNIDANGPGDISIMKATGPVITKVNGSGEMYIGQ